jgi:hypothetical protein
LAGRGASQNDCRNQTCQGEGLKVPIHDFECCGVPPRSTAMMFPRQYCSRSSNCLAT